MCTGTRWAMLMSFKSLVVAPSGRLHFKFSGTSPRAWAAAWPFSEQGSDSDVADLAPAVPIFGRVAQSFEALRHDANVT